MKVFSLFKIYFFCKNQTLLKNLNFEKTIYLKISQISLLNNF